LRGDLVVQEGRVVAVDLDIEHCASHSSAIDAQLGSSHPMTLAVEPPAVLGLDAGVIEEARARQRRHRGGVAVAVALAALIAVLVAGWLGGGGSSNGVRRGDSSPGLRPLPRVQSPSTTSVVAMAPCVSTQLRGRFGVELFVELSAHPCITSSS
jgi:hypothetical protein